MTTTGFDTTDRFRTSMDIAAFVFLVVGVVVTALIFWPWSDDVFVGPRFDALRIVTAGGGIAAAIWIALERPALRWRLSDTSATLFLVLNVLAYALSVDRQTSLLGESMLQTGLVTVFAFAGAYAIARISVRNLSRLRVLFAAVSASATIAAAYGVVQIANIDPIWSDLPLGRVFSSLGQPNWLAAYLVVAIPLTTAWAIARTRPLERLAGFGAVILQTAVLFATLSRSGYAGIIAACIVGVAVALTHGLRIPGYRKKLIAAVAAFLASAALVLASLSAVTPDVAPANIARRVASATDLEGFESQQYIALWKVGLAIAIDHPFTGTGQGTYAIMFPQYRDTVLDESMARYLSDFRPESAHNVYLSIAAAAGFAALAAYGILIVGTFATILPHIRSGRQASILLVGLIAALAGHLVTDLFMTIDLAGSWLFWVLMGAGLAVADHSESEAIEHSDHRTRPPRHFKPARGSDTVPDPD